MKTCIFIFVALVLAALFPSCSSAGPNTQRGAAGGAVAGAVIGGIIGHQSGETGAGAALGAAAGGLAGGAYGNRKDNASGTSGQDLYGYTPDDYLSLLNGDEKATLRARAPDRSGSELADYLTSQEKANLRARAASQREIGR
jgi:hypothetical protein